ncbi:unnamed protein product [Miscanthus lutarioriparius]|uniref:DUF569 domain-containing protein n=1 Tax=Miscanthus lutarioriparius TaxID=422564 RepID=A0A811SAL6_9POAL|nr:unnamed protein product [Miscanthus lutarioriparius]
MEFFPDGMHLRLRNRKHGTYLHADEDGVYVSLSLHRASLNTAWQVHRVLRDGGNEYVLLHSAAYGRYLALSPDQVSLVYVGHHAVQGVYESPEQDDVLWRPSGWTTKAATSSCSTSRTVSSAPPPGTHS